MQCVLISSLLFGAGPSNAVACHSLRVAALSVKWDATGQPPVSTAKMPDGVHLDVHSPVHGKVRSAGLLAIGIGLTPFWFIFGNNCFLTIPPAHVAAVYDPLRGGVQS